MADFEDYEKNLINANMIKEFSVDIMIHLDSGDFPCKGIFDEEPSELILAGSKFTPNQPVVSFYLDISDTLKKGTRMTIKSVLYSVESPPLPDDGMVVYQLKLESSKTDAATPDLRY